MIEKIDFITEGDFIRPPTDKEMMDKINELVKAVNQLKEQAPK